MKKILVSGASGFIGFNLVKKLIQLKMYDVYIIVRDSTNVMKFERILEKNRFINLEDSLKVYEKIKEIAPDVYIHLAGAFISEHSRENIQVLLDSNVKDATILLDAVCCAGCKKIINTSSYWQNFDNQQYFPVNLYAATKQAFETILDYYYRRENMSIISLCIFDTYGPNDQRRKILNLIHDLPGGGEIDLTDGKQKMYLVYIDDVVSAFLRAIDLIIDNPTKMNQKYSVRSKADAIELRVILEKAIRIWGKDVRLNFGAVPRRRGEIENPSGFGVILPNWEQKISLEKGLELYNDFRRM